MISRCLLPFLNIFSKHIGLKLQLILFILLFFDISGLADISVGGYLYSADASIFFSYAFGLTVHGLCEFFSHPSTKFLSFVCLNIHFFMYTKILETWCCIHLSTRTRDVCNHST